jgi:pimeloyl-ACP methyl ester carboxylesterase
MKTRAFFMTTRVSAIVFGRETPTVGYAPVNGRKVYYEIHGSGDPGGADKLKATEAPILFIHGDADGVRLDHISEMFHLKGGDVFGDMRPRSESRLAILPNTTHGTLMERMTVIVPMVKTFSMPRRKGHEEAEQLFARRTSVLS